MALRNSAAHYGSGAKFFHWFIALLVIFMVFLGFFMGYASKPSAPIVYTIHKSTGLTILFLMMLRLLWKIINPRPTLPNTIKTWERISAWWVHLCLYLVLFCMPLSGWIMSTAAGRPPNFWWLWRIPSPWTPLSKTVSSTASDIHTVLAWVLVALIVIHVGAACKHYFINKDGVVDKMRPCGHHTKNT